MGLYILDPDESLFVYGRVNRTTLNGREYLCLVDELWLERFE